MNVASPTAAPMTARSADALSGTMPGTGFGDLLNILTATPDGPAMPAAGAVAADAPGTGPAKSATTAAADETDDGAVPADGLPVPAAPIEDAGREPATNSPTAAQTDADRGGAANPAELMPKVDPSPIPQPVVGAAIPAAPRAAPDATVDALPRPEPAVAVAADDGADDAAKPATDAPAPATSLATAASRIRTPRPGNASMPNAPAALPAEALADTGSPAPQGDPAKERIAAPEERGKGRSPDRGAARADMRAAALADPSPQPMPTPLAAVMQQPLADQPQQADGSPPSGAPSDASGAATPFSPDAPALQNAGEPGQSQQAGADNLPALLASQQTPTGPIARAAPPVQPYPAAPAVPSQPVIAAQPGRIGRDMGVEIARQVSAGRQEMLVRLDPAEMGRIDVRLSFDDKGHLHATLSADSPAALDMLRRDADDLGRALAGAGIHADPSAFRFDSRGGDSSQFAQHQPQGDPRGQSHDRDGSGRRGRDADTFDPMPASYRQLRTSSRVDLTA